MRKLAGWKGMAVAAMALALGACATRAPRPPRGPFQAPETDLSAVAPVSEREGQKPEVAFVLALSGGGHRAANFAAGVMVGLEELQVVLDGRPTNALREVDYLSGVSGGNLAAGAYISSLHDHLFFGGEPDEYSFREALEGNDRGLTDPELFAHLREGYTGLLIARMLSPFSGPSTDRGDGLQEKINASILGAAWRERRLKEDGVARYGCVHGPNPDLTFGCMFARAGTGTVRLPYWIPSATAFENGAVFPFTPGQLNRYGITGYRHHMTRVDLDESGGWRRFPLAFGATASCAFPAALPPRTLRSERDPENPYLHLQDGGLSDNLGITTGLQLLRKERTAARRVLVVVDAFVGEFAPFSAVETAPGVLPVLIRDLSIALDSEHGRVDRRLRTAEAGMSNLRTLRISFEDFETLDSLEPLKRYGLRDSDIASFDGSKSPIEHLRSIATAFSISERDQRLLYAAGRYAVDRLKGGLLREALGDDLTAPVVEVADRATSTR